MRTTMFTEPGATPSGSLSDVRSHTEACMVPHGGERYNGLCLT